MGRRVRTGNHGRHVGRGPVPQTSGANSLGPSQTGLRMTAVEAAGSTFENRCGTPGAELRTHAAPLPKPVWFVKPGDPAHKLEVDEQALPQPGPRSRSSTPRYLLFIPSRVNPCLLLRSA